MEVKIVLCIVLFACCWFADGCGRGSSDTDTDFQTRQTRSLNRPAKGHKGTVGKKGVHYSIALNPCSFIIYDVNQGGDITKDELYAILGFKGETDALFTALDMTDDGVIEPDEFYVKAPLVITQCFDSDK